MGKTLQLTIPMVETIGEVKPEFTYASTAPYQQPTSTYGSSISAYQVLAAEAKKAGFNRGAIVMLRNDPSRQRWNATHPKYWGVVVDIVTFRPTEEPKFKPVRVMWFLLVV